MTTAPAAPQDFFLYGPDGQALTSSTPQATAIESPADTAGDWRAVQTSDNATVWEKIPAPTAVDAQAVERIDQLEAQLTALTAPVPSPQPQPEPTAKSDEKTRKGFDQWGPWIALWAAVGLTASGEYALAKFVGFHPAVSALLPIGIDIYVIQAFRRHRDVAAALILMVVTNALVHLAEAGLFGVETTIGPRGETVHEATWWLIVIVSAIAPFIVWRVHRITETTPHTVAAAHAETVSEPVAETAPATADPVSRNAETPVAGPRATPSGTRHETPHAVSETSALASATGTPATRETAAHQRETAPTTRRATPRRNAPARSKKTAETGVAAPSRLLTKDEQMAIVGQIVDSWNDGEKDLQPIVDALGCSKATASRRATEYLDRKTA